MMSKFDTSEVLDTRLEKFTKDFTVEIRYDTLIITSQAGIDVIPHVEPNVFIPRGKTYPLLVIDEPLKYVDGKITIGPIPERKNVKLTYSAKTQRYTITFVDFTEETKLNPVRELTGVEIKSMDEVEFIGTMRISTDVARAVENGIESMDVVKMNQGVIPDTEHIQLLAQGVYSGEPPDIDFPGFAVIKRMGVPVVFGHEFMFALYLELKRLNPDFPDTYFSELFKPDLTKEGAKVILDPGVGQLEVFLDYERYTGGNYFTMEQLLCWAVGKCEQAMLRD